VRVCADIAARWALAENTGQMLGTTPPRITVRWQAEPPPVLVSDNDIPLIELHAKPEGDDDEPAPPAS
jgi:hypothetical protein